MKPLQTVPLLTALAPIAAAAPPIAFIAIVGAGLLWLLSDDEKPKTELTAAEFPKPQPQPKQLEIVKPQPQPQERSVAVTESKPSAPIVSAPGSFHSRFERPLGEPRSIDHRWTQGVSERR
jgi:hypothetical protein